MRIGSPSVRAEVVTPTSQDGFGVSHLCCGPKHANPGLDCEYGATTGRYLECDGHRWNSSVPSPKASLPFKCGVLAAARAISTIIDGALGTYARADCAGCPDRWIALDITRAAVLSDPGTAYKIRRKLCSLAIP
jgi:hypothetical protein